MHVHNRTRVSASKRELGTPRGVTVERGNLGRRLDDGTTVGVAQRERGWSAAAAAEMGNSQ